MKIYAHDYYGNVEEFEFENRQMVFEWISGDEEATAFEKFFSDDSDDPIPSGHIDDLEMWVLLGRYEDDSEYVRPNLPDYPAPPTVDGVSKVLWGEGEAPELHAEWRVDKRWQTGPKLDWINHRVEVRTAVEGDYLIQYRRYIKDDELILTKARVWRIASPLDEVMTAAAVESEYGLQPGTVRQYLNRHADDMRVRRVAWKADARTWLILRDEAHRIWSNT